MRANPVKARLREGGSTIGTWLSLASPLAARFLARTSFDWLTVDVEHSPVDWETAATIFGHVAEAGGVPLVRVPAGKHDHIKRALDSGAFGVVVPMVMDRVEAERCVAASKYPPIGDRSVGGSLHALNFDAEPAEYFSRANDEILAVLQCEHIEAVRRADEIFSAPGIDAIFVGPNDLRASMRSAGGADPSAEEFESALETIRLACDRHGVAPGLHVFSIESARERLDQGWRFIALGSDLSLMLEAAGTGLTALGRNGRKAANY
jgi:4-hydroxy-2-oxoheptanedioate aldolase